MVRGPDRRRGADEFVPVSWDEALDRLAAELRRVYAKHGPHAVFGGSYGWASAGRFHDAQHQLHRFLNLAGGYVRSVGSYSAGAASVILPHVIGPQGAVAGNNVSWDELVAESALVLAFGGMALKNNDVGGGGTSRHIARERLDAARKRGVEFHLIGPLRDDLPEDLAAFWHPIRPGTDVALMLGLAYTLVAEGLHDAEFLARYCTGWDDFSAYLRGRSDGQPKTAAWAAAICGMPEAEIVALARRIAGRRTLVTCSMSLQRAEHGEQPVWMAAVLAAMLGQIGLPGGGFAFALGAVSNTGKPPVAVPLPEMPVGHNAIDAFIPVARIADMLLNPGEGFDFNGQHLTYPDIRLVYWAGGNPFHHHQHLGRLRDAFARPDTVVVHELVWTATARHADIVLPATITLEREDIGAAAGDPLMVAMHRAVRALRRGARRPCDLRRAGRASRVCRPLHRGPLAAPVARTYLRADPPGAGRTRPQRAELRRVLGAGRAGACRPRRGTAASSAPSAATPTPRNCRRRAAASRFSRRRSPVSIIPTAPAIRPGWSRSRR